MKRFPKNGIKKETVGGSNPSQTDPLYNREKLPVPVDEYSTDEKESQEKFSPGFAEKVFDPQTR